jgi:hypothetical protein
MVSIIIPWVRVDGFNRCIDALFESFYRGTKFLYSQRFEVVAEKDFDLIGCNPMVNKLVKRSKYPIVCFLHDDSEPQKGFLEAALAEMAKFDGGWGGIGLNDLQHGPDGPPTHWMIHKNMLRYFPDGVFYSEEYIHTRVDRELKDICVENGRWRWAEDAKVVHHSRVNKGRKHFDDLVLRCYGKKNIEHDRMVYERRKGERDARKNFCGS